jgi:hypothetical protein
MPGFVVSPNAISLGMIGKTFGRRPSELLGEPDPVIALAVDEAVMMRLHYAEQAGQASSKAKGEIPAGQRYESTDEILATTGHVH